MVDDAGYLWVLQSRDADAKSTEFDVFAPDGVFLGVVSVADRVELLLPTVIRGDRMIYVVKGAFDVPFVVVRRVVGRSP